MEKNDSTKVLAELKQASPEAAAREQILCRIIRDSGVDGGWERHVAQDGIRYRSRRGNVLLEWGFKLKDESRPGTGYLLVALSSGFGASIEIRNRFHQPSENWRMSVDLHFDQGRGELDGLFQACFPHVAVKDGFLEATQKIAQKFFTL